MKRLTYFLSCLLLLSLPAASRASSTWALDPVSNSWNNKQNWTPAVVPKGRATTAEFSVSNLTQVTETTARTIGTIDFESGASAFTITVKRGKSFSVGGLGVTNESGVMQNFVVANESASMNFHRGATIGSMTQFTIEGATDSGTDGGRITFTDLSSPGAGNFIVDGASVTGLGGGGTLQFMDDTFAGTATFTVNGAGVAGGNAGSVAFGDATTADNSVFTVQGGALDSANGGVVTFDDNSRAKAAVITNNGGTANAATGGLTDFASGFAENATLIANAGTNGGGGGLIKFEGDADGGVAAVQLSGNGSLDISGHDVVAVTIGSLAGDGDVSLGTVELTVGGNNVTTTFSGLIHDAGSIAKAGGATLALAGANTYTGGTTIRNGILLVKNTTGSATGSGPVDVKVGILGGPGIIAGDVTVGTGSGIGAYLAPSKGTTATITLTLQGAVTCNNDGTLSYKIKSIHTPTFDLVIANGVTIANQASFSLQVSGSETLPVGTVVTVISNTSTDPIAGTFANLPDGGTISENGMNFQANYEGGDGNDLTLTVTD